MVSKLLFRVMLNDTLEEFFHKCASSELKQECKKNIFKIPNSNTCEGSVLV